MKTLILSLIAIATISMTTFGQLQNFDSGVWPPVSPNTITTPIWGGGGTFSGDPATWYRSDDPVVNGAFGNNGLDVGYGGSGNCAILYSNEFDGYEPFFEVDMIINNIDISSYNAPMLKFYMKHPDGNEEIEIAVSSMGGPYSVLQTFTSNFTDWTLLSVDLSAFIGSPDLTIRFRGKESNPFSADMTNVGIDNIEVIEQTNMVYVSSTTTHVGCGLKQGYDDQKIMRVDVVTQGSLNPLNITDFLMNTNGSTNDCNDVLLKKIYSTGTNSAFNTSNLVGSSDLTGNYTITGSLALIEGTNYFWVACDIPSTSTLSNVVDAECTGLVIDGNTEIPTVTAPAGNLVINNTGVFAVTNLNDTGAGSLRAAIAGAASYGCGDAYVDATAIAGTINWSSNVNVNASHDVSIMGAGPDLLSINSGGSGYFIQNQGDGLISIKGLKIEQCAGQAAVYGANGKKFSVENCWFDSNSARAIYMPNDPNLTVRNTTFSNNNSGGSGGAIYIVNDFIGKFYNCTFYGNTSGDQGGALQAINGSYAETSLIIENCTFSSNNAVSSNGGGGLRFTNGSCEILNSSFDNNLSAGVPRDIVGSIIMNYSHLSNTTSASISGGNNVLNVSGNLGVLANYGGATPTCSINPGSPLINAGTANIEYDQRGFCRPNTSDIGAFEYNGVEDVIAPVPDVASLPDLVYCPLTEVTTLIYPTATENCSSNIIVTHNACLPITTPGTTVVTWTYEDGNGNTSTQIQNVLIADVTAPVADVASLTDVTDECSVAALTAPTATDNCGVVSVTNNAVLPITAQGTTVVTWTYDDGNGNTTTQDQNIVITDVTAPVADTASLTDVTECFEATPTAPTATDNCAGVLTATPDVTFPIMTAGSTVVTWTYDDGNGNTSTQTQNVVVNSVDVNVTQSGSLLTADAIGAAYMWLDCDNGNAIVNGETNQAFTPAVTGNYAVEVTENGCVDTSACYLVDYTGLDDLFSASLLVYPNPSNDGYFNIQFEGTISAVVLYDMLGRIIAVPFNVNQGTLDASLLEAGKYIISINSNEGVFIKQIVITK